jgi:hypothetical protein
MAHAGTSALRGESKTPLFLCVTTPISEPAQSLRPSSRPSRSGCGAVRRGTLILLHEDDREIDPVGGGHHAVLALPERRPSDWLQESARSECGRIDDTTFRRNPLAVELTNINKKGRKLILCPPYLIDGFDKRDKRTEILERDRI